MSLIWKAMQRVDSRRDSLHVVDAERPRGPVANEDVVDVPFERAAPRPPTPETAPGPRFEINVRSLAKQGFVTPNTLGAPIAREISAIKRRLVRRLNFFHREGRRERQSENTILVSSAHAGEGKTFIALNLALSLVIEEKLNVLLVDADLAAPGLGRILQIDADAGLSDWLQGRAKELGPLLHRATSLPLSVLSAGPRPDAAAELLGSARMAALMRDLASRYSDRIVIMDGPPILATTEASILAQHAHQVVLVADANRATAEVLNAALELMDCDDKTALVLNRSPFRQESYMHSAPYGSDRNSAP